MTAIVPHRFLFRFAFPVLHAEGRPRRRGRILELPETHRLSDLSGLDGQPSFAELRLGWNVNGLGISVDVRGKSLPTLSNPERPAETEGLQVWIDTRNTQSIHRASRYCHYFCLLPTGGGEQGTEAVGVQLAVPRAREDAPLADSENILVASEICDDGYRLEAWLSSDVLQGYDPEAQPQLGFYYFLRDAELGNQYLTVGPEFPFESDPSLWSTLDLQK